MPRLKKNIPEKKKNAACCREDQGCAAWSGEGAFFKKTSIQSGEERSKDKKRKVLG